MTVHIFGAVCSPSICTLALRQTARDYGHKYPDVAEKKTSDLNKLKRIIAWILRAKKLFRNKESHCVFSQFLPVFELHLKIKQSVDGVN